MTTITEILDELNIENGSNYKLDILRKYRDNVLLQRVLQMTFDRVKYTYGLSANRWLKPGPEKDAVFNDSEVYEVKLEDVLDFMTEKLATREITGNEAIDLMHGRLLYLSLDETILVVKILNRDLRINMGRTQINKVFPGLITKQLYMRCAVYSKDTAKKINPKDAIVQLKADGTYREFTVEDGVVTATSRSGEEYEYPVIFAEMLKNIFPDGHYFGELTVVENGVVFDRSKGNGLINSLKVPHDDVMFDCWDYVTLEEYTDASNKVKCKTPYWKRLQTLKSVITLFPEENYKNVRMIETHVVSSISDALKHCNYWMNLGLEGAILKDRDSVFRDGTNPQQLKLKLEIEIDLRIVGFQEGTIGTVREKTFGAILAESDDGLIKCKTSGFTDEQLKDFNSRRAELVGMIIAIKCNDLTKARGNEYYALSHPRFSELRNDKTETDALERALELKKMAMELS